MTNGDRKQVNVWYLWRVDIYYSTLHKQAWLIILEPDGFL